MDVTEGDAVINISDVAKDIAIARNDNWQLYYAIDDVADNKEDKKEEYKPRGGRVNEKNNKEIIFKNVLAGLKLVLPDNNEPLIIVAKHPNSTASTDKQMVKLDNPRPRWIDVFNGYPKNNNTIWEDVASGRVNNIDDVPSEEIFSSIFGSIYNQTKFNNACATRISIALLRAGVTISEKIEIIDSGKTYTMDTSTITHGDLKLMGGRVITGASTLHGWLEKKWGKPKGDNEVFSPVTSDKIRKQFNGKTGIYIARPIDPKSVGGITGHCTLWTGKDVIGYAWVSNAFIARLWELK
jgi:hypothetical protein